MSLPVPPEIRKNDDKCIGYHQGCECMFDVSGYSGEETDLDDLPETADGAKQSETSYLQESTRVDSEPESGLDEPEMLRPTMPTVGRKKQEQRHKPIYDVDGRLMNPEGILLDERAPQRYKFIVQPGERYEDKFEHARMAERRADVDRVNQALLNSSYIKVKDVTKEMIESRKKGPSYTKTAAKMHQEMNERLEMHEGEVIARTCQVVGEDGTLLASYFGRHEEHPHGRSKEKTSTNDWHDVTKAMEEAKKQALKPRIFKDEESIIKWIEEEKPVWDGLQTHCLENIAWHTQHYCNLCLVEKSKDNKRYSKGNNLGMDAGPDIYEGKHAEWMRIKSKIPPQCTEFVSSHLRGARVAELRNKYKESKEESKSKDTIGTGEALDYLVRVGVRFLDRNWPIQGFPTALTTSDDLTGRCCYQTDAGLGYMRTTNQYIQALLTPYMVAAVGKREYQTMRKAYRAAALDAEEEESEGFHTGQAICYNEVVLQHVDAEDSGYCAIFCVGRHRGGYLYLPDVNLTFYYCPGTVIVFKSSLLYHGVTRWFPFGDVKPNGLLPGRISIVLYTKKAAFEELKSKKPGHVRRERGGMMAKEDSRPKEKKHQDIVTTELYKPLLQTSGNWWGNNRDREADMEVAWSPVGPTKE